MRFAMFSAPTTTLQELVNQYSATFLHSTVTSSSNITNGTGSDVTTRSDPRWSRWHFSDFTHAMMLVFRVVCGEWVEPLWDCMDDFGYTCVPYFLLVYLVGNLLVSTSRLLGVPDDVF